jgi:DNA-binding response OmpR family regulator
MRILVVEDDRTTLTMLARTLQSRGHEVCARGDGESAWDQFSENPFELVVLDWVMPGMTGLELCRRIRELPEGDQCVILIITARDSAEDLDEVLEAGADDYLAKPIDMGQLRVRLAVTERKVDDRARRKQAELERLEMERQVQYMHKVESLGVLAGGIAHEFNNMLMGILGNAGLALMDLSPESKQHGYLKRIEETAYRAANLSSQMLAFSGKAKFVRQPLDLSRVLDTTREFVDAAVPKKTQVVFELESNLPALEGDPDQISQVLLTLVTNAAEAIGDTAGAIHVRSGVMDADSDYLANQHQDHPLPPGCYTYLEVADTGCGMDADTLERIFEPFFTTKFTGRGLGLAALQGIVRSHEGVIKIDSAIDKGTTVRILFPAMEEIVETPPSPETVEADDQGCSVLLVDDELTVLEVTEKTLEHFGFEVVTATNGREAVDLFETRPTDFSAVVLDLTMPVMDGHEAFKELRRIRPDIKVILTSGYTEEDATESWNDDDLAGFLHKPFMSSELVDLLNHSLGLQPSA